MHPQELINRLLIAATVAENDGYKGTAAAFRQLAAEMGKTGPSPTSIPVLERESATSSGPFIIC